MGEKLTVTCFICHILVISSLEIERKNTGDKLGSGELCDSRTFVIKRNATRRVTCQTNMRPDCDGMFFGSIKVGYVPKDEYNTTLLQIRLFEKAVFGTNLACANHSAGRIDVQDAKNSTTSVWDTFIGEEVIKNTITYKFDYTNKKLFVGFTKHWDGLLIKVFINCSDENGDNILTAAETRCVLIKYQGNVTYPLTGDKYFPSTSTTTSTAPSTASTKASSNVVTETTTTTATTTSTKSSFAVPLKSEDESNNLVVLIGGIGGAIIVLVIIVLVIVIFLCRKTHDRNVTAVWNNQNIVISSHGKNEVSNKSYSAVDVCPSKTTLKADNAGYEVVPEPSSNNMYASPKDDAHEQEELPEYAVVNKSEKYGSAQSSLDVEVNNPENQKQKEDNSDEDIYSEAVSTETDIYSDAVGKIQSYGPEELDVYDEPVSQQREILDEYAVVDKSRKYKDDNEIYN